MLFITLLLSWFIFWNVFFRADDKSGGERCFSKRFYSVFRLSRFDRSNVNASVFPHPPTEQNKYDDPINTFAWFFSLYFATGKTVCVPRNDDIKYRKTKKRKKPFYVFHNVQILAAWCIHNSVYDVSVLLANNETAAVKGDRLVDMYAAAKGHARKSRFNRCSKSVEQCKYALNEKLLRFAVCSTLKRPTHCGLSPVFHSRDIIPNF